MIRYTYLTMALCLTTLLSYAQQSPEEKLVTLGITLPMINPQPNNSYMNVLRIGNLIYVSGKGPLKSDGSFVSGKAGQDITLEKAKDAARLCAIHHLAVLKTELGNLAKIKRIVNVTGYINCSPDFYNQSGVMDGYSNLMIAVLADAGKHTRTSIGVASLPNNWTVEADLIIELYE